MRKRPPQPTHRAIVEANGALLATLDVPLEDAACTCWGCGASSEGWRPARAHVQALTHGGSSEPGNFFLLCDRCHDEQPDGAPREELRSLEPGEALRLVQDGYERAAGRSIGAARANMRAHIVSTFVAWQDAQEAADAR